MRSQASRLSIYSRYNCWLLSRVDRILAISRFVEARLLEASVKDGHEILTLILERAAKLMVIGLIIATALLVGNASPITRMLYGSRACY
jgi:peptidoglycan biosynthesis protein MviN/MurJ (putative lipid II flippase)